MNFKVGDRVYPRREYILKQCMPDIGTIVDVSTSEMTFYVKWDSGGLGTWRAHQLELANGVAIMLKLLD